MEKGRELTLLQSRKSREKNRNALIAKSLELKESQKEFGTVKNATRNLHQTHTI